MWRGERVRRPVRRQKALPEGRPAGRASITPLPRPSAPLWLPGDQRGVSGRVQAWMGHADQRTTARYLHYKERVDEADRLAAAFRNAELWALGPQVAR